MFGSPPSIDPSIVRDVAARGVLIQSERGVLIKSECPVLIVPDWGVLIGSEWGVLEKSDYPVLITPEYSLCGTFQHYSTLLWQDKSPRNLTASKGFGGGEYRDRTGDLLHAK